MRLELETDFRAAAERGVLLLRRCFSCDEVHFYPRAHCPRCGHAKTAWIEASGRGVLHSVTAAPMLPPGKYPAMVELLEGPVIETLVTDADYAALSLGEDLRLSFVPGPDGRLLAGFVPPRSLAARAYAARVLTGAAGAAGADAAGPVVARIAIVGAGTMGQGIAAACLNAGLEVTLIDRDTAVLERAQGAIADHVGKAIARGKAHPETETRRETMLLGTEMAAIAPADVVIEAVYESLALKQKVISAIDAHARPGAILGTNTSTLDIDRIAGATQRPEAVVGLHFFSPAHIVKLLEVVRGAATAPETLAVARALGRRLGKTAIVVGNAHGFVGNRLMLAREEEAHRLLLQGALPQEVDRVLTEFGLPMGTFTLQDMAAGIEVMYRERQERGATDWLGDRLFAAGRTGLKAGKGYYRYDPGRKTPKPDPEVEALIREWSASEGVLRRRIPASEMQDRLILPMLNAGLKLLEAGIAARAEDIDAVWLLGYGWPAWRGGPMYHAQMLGLDVVLDRLRALEAAEGAAFTPAPLLERLVAEGRPLIEDAA